MNTWSRTLLTFFALSYVSMTAHAGQVNACNADQYDKFLEARKVWQNGLDNIVHKTLPRFKQTSEMFKQEQMLLIEANRIEFEYLYKNKPDQIHPDKPFNTWLEITEQDKQKIARQNNRYKEILEQTTYSEEIRKKRKAAIASMRKVTMDSNEFYDLAQKQREIMKQVTSLCDSGSNGA
ncbi:MAG: hypothetical protein PVH98_00195 [Gammaproteobacteria bacterium]|jgi:hypothetical protein